MGSAMTTDIMVGSIVGHIAAIVVGNITLLEGSLLHGSNCQARMLPYK